MEEDPLAIDETEINSRKQIQITEFAGCQDESSDSSNDNISVIEVKEEPLDVKMEASETDETINHISGIDDVQDFVVEKVFKDEDDLLEGKRSSGSEHKELKREKEGKGKHDLEELSCSNCDFIFESKDDLTSHLESLCKEKFKCSRRSSENLKIDPLINDNLGQSNLKTKSFTCSECSFKCNNEVYLEKHMISHQNIKSNEDTRLFKCSECNYESNDNRNLEVHMSAHEMFRLFKCSKCNYKCNNEEDLKTHMYSHQNLIVLFKCSLCNYRCNEIGNLKAHMSSHQMKLSECSKYYYKVYGENLVQVKMPSQKKFKCSDCTYECKAEISLKRHVVKHHYKSYKCGKCNFETNYKPTLDKHMLKKSVHKRKVSKCSECNFKCIDLKYMEKHVLAHQIGECSSSLSN